MVPKIIGLCGCAHSGKDTVADYICARFNYQKVSVAAPIRTEWEEFLTTAITKEAAVRGLNRKFDFVIDAFRKAVWAKPTSPEQRVGLQYWGTDHRRDEDSHYWTPQQRIMIDSVPLAVICDVRDPLEIDLIREMKGELWYILRPGRAPVGIPGHKTETSIQPEDGDRTLDNDGSIEDLYAKIEYIFRFC